MAESSFKRIVTGADFVKVECAGCNNTQVIFARATTAVTCSKCDEQLVQPTGGLAKVNGTLVQEMQ